MRSFVWRSEYSWILRSLEIPCDCWQLKRVKVVLSKKRPLEMLRFVIVSKWQNRYCIAVKFIFKTIHKLPQNSGDFIIAYFCFFFFSNAFYANNFDMRYGVVYIEHKHTYFSTGIFIIYTLWMNRIQLVVWCNILWCHLVKNTVIIAVNSTETR